MVSPGDVAHHFDDSTVLPPQMTTDFVVVHRWRAITLVPGEIPFTPISEEDILGVVVVGIPLGIHPLLRRELVVEVVCDGRLACGTLRDMRDRNPSSAQHPAGGRPVARRTRVVGGAQRLGLLEGQNGPVGVVHCSKRGRCECVDSHGTIALNIEGKGGKTWREALVNGGKYL